MTSTDQNDPNYAMSTWERALETCRQSLNHEDYEHILQLRSYDSILDSIKQMQALSGRNDLPSILSRVPQSLARFSGFLFVFAVVTSGNDDVLQTTLIWGAVHLSLEVCASYNVMYSSIFSETVSLLVDMSHDLEIFKMYEWLFRQDNGLNDLLVDVLADVLIFWVHMARFLRRNPLANLARMTWSNIREEFDETTSRIRKRLKQVKEAAEALSLKQASLQNQHLNDAFERYSISEPPLDEILPFSNIPFPQNPQFFGRSSELQRIHSELDAGPDSHRYGCLTLTGMGGAGKTQIALRYAYERLQSGTDIVIWIHSDGELAILQSFTKVANLLRLPGASDALEQNRTLVKQWLQRSRISWLLIFDNVEDSTHVAESIPATTNGSVLITARNERIALEAASKSLAVPPFSVSEGSALLLTIVQREQYSDADRKAAEDLSETLDGLPLALSLIASQILLRHMSVVQFLGFFKIHSDNLFKRGRPRSTYYKHGIDTAFHASFDSLDETSILVYGIACFIASDDIPDALFKPDPSSPIGSEAPWDDVLAVDDAIQNLLSASLLTRDPLTEKYRVHRLLQQQFRDWLGEERRETAYYNAARLLFEAFPKQVNMQTLHPFWPTCKQYIQHVASLGGNILKYKYNDLPWSRLETFVMLSSNAAWYLLETAAMNQSSAVLDVAFKCCKTKDTLLYATLCQTAGIVQREQARTTQAYPWFEKCLDIRVKLLPPDHEDLANIYTNMAGAYLTDYRTDEAIQMYTDALNIDLKLPWEERKTIFLRYENLGIAYVYKEMYAKSKEVLDESHKYILAFFGPDTHYEAMENLYRSTLLIAEGKYVEARSCCDKAIKNFIEEEEYHPTTLGAHYKLSTIDLAEGQVDDAIGRLRRVLEMCQIVEPTKGSQSHTARASWKLSRVLFQLDPDSEEAASLMKTAEDIRKDIQGDKYKDLPPEDHSYDMLIAHFFR